MENPFLKLWQSDYNPFKREEKSAIGIDIGSSAIKVVQLRRERGVAVLETYGEIALGPYAGLQIGQAASLPPDKLVEVLLDVMTEANVTCRTGGISIPFMSSLVTMVRMPALPEKQLNKMIPVEARKYIPVPVSEVSLDWFIVPEGDEEILAQDGGQGDEGNSTFSLPRTKVLLVAIHNDVLSTYQSLVQNAGLKASFYEIEIFSSIRATIGQTLSPVAVLDIGAGKTKLYVVEYGVVKMSHLVNRGSQDISLSLSRALGLEVGRAEELKRERGLLGEDALAREAMLSPLNHIFSEVNRVLLSYERKHSRNIGRVILTGGGAVLKGLLPLAQEKLETEAVLGDPFSKTETPAFLEEVLRQVGPEFAVAVGLALRKLQGAA